MGSSGGEEFGDFNPEGRPLYTSSLTVSALKSSGFRPKACEQLAQGKERSDAALGRSYSTRQAKGLRDSFSQAFGLICFSSATQCVALG
jgi:hypothetical protein